MPTIEEHTAILIPEDGEYYYSENRIVTSDFGSKER